MSMMPLVTQLYAYCRNNPVRYVDPSGHGTESAPTKNTDPNNSQNAQDLLDLINEMNNTSGAIPDDIVTIMSLAEEFGLDTDSLDIKTVNEVNGPVVQELAADATLTDVETLLDWAAEYDVDPNSMGITEDTPICYVCASSWIYGKCMGYYGTTDCKNEHENWSGHRYYGGIS